MADTGPPWNIPYSVGTDPPDDPVQSQARARKIHANEDLISGSVYGLNRYNLYGWSTPVDAVETITAVTTNRMYGVRVPVARTGTVSAIQMYMSGAAGLTVGQCWAGIYNVTSGALLASTADMSTLWLNATVKDMPLTVALDVTVVADVMVAFLANGTTMPQIARSTTQSALLTNVNLALADSRSVLFTGTFTTLPPTMPAFTTNGTVWWVGLR